jgi:hypothetical protein
MLISMENIIAVVVVKISLLPLPLLILLSLLTLPLIILLILIQSFSWDAYYTDPEMAGGYWEKLLSFNEGVFMGKCLKWIIGNDGPSIIRINLSALFYRHRGENDLIALAECP